MTVDGKLGGEALRPAVITGAGGGRAYGRRAMPFYPYLVRPRAVVDGDTLRVAMSDSRGRPLVFGYNSADRTWHEPVAAAEPALKNDDHGCPALHRGDDGRLHLFYGCHNGPMRHLRSARPGDVTAWDTLAPAAEHATYPQVIGLGGGRALLFHRGRGHSGAWVGRLSEDDGATWGEPQAIVELRRDPPDPFAAAYCRFVPDAGGGVHCVWNWKDDTVALINRGILDDHPRRKLAHRGLTEEVYRYHVYCLRRDAGGTWHDAAGEPIDLPVTKASADARCRIFDSGDNFAWPQAFAADGDGNFYVHFLTGVSDWLSGETRVPMEPRFATSRGGAWSVADQPGDDWPAHVVATLRSPGPPADGEYPPRWHCWSAGLDDVRSGVYLHHADEGIIAPQRPFEVD